MLIKVPDERAAQLKALADSEGITITDLIGRFINREIKAGRLPDETPGFRFTPNGKEIYVDIEGIKTLTISGGDALSVAKGLERVARTGGAFLDMDAPGQPKIGCVGSGVYLEFSGAGAKGRRVVARSVALDIARQLRSAVARVTAACEIENVDALLDDLEFGAVELDIDQATKQAIEGIGDLESGT
jgi:hypothetical protein